MFRALKSNGVQTRLFVAEREGHQWGELRHKLFKANAELEWFEKYAMGRNYVWEKAPGDPGAERTDLPVPLAQPSKAGLVPKKFDSYVKYFTKCSRAAARRKE